MQKVTEILCVGILYNNIYATIYSYLALYSVGYALAVAVNHGGLPLIFQQERRSQYTKLQVGILDDASELNVLTVDIMLS